MFAASSDSKISGFTVYTLSDSLRIIFSFLLWIADSKYPDSLPNSSDACGRKLYRSERKIRVDGRVKLLITADSTFWIVIIIAVIFKSTIPKALSLEIRKKIPNIRPFKPQAFRRLLTLCDLNLMYGTAFLSIVPEFLPLAIVD